MLYKVNYIAKVYKKVLAAHRFRFFNAIYSVEFMSSPISKGNQAALNSFFYSQKSGQNDTLFTLKTHLYNLLIIKQSHCKPFIFTPIFYIIFLKYT